MKKLLVLISIMMIALAVTSCKSDDDNPTGTTEGVKEISIQHFGIDWSEGLTGDQVTDYNNVDGETIAWCPTGNGGGWSQGIWYRATSEKTYRINATDFTGVNSIDTSMWATDLCGTPLTPGSIWATKANDGYVVFRVVEVATDSVSISNDPLWAAKVQYKFSTSTQF